MIGLDSDGNAEGYMYWDNGEELEYSNKNTQVKYNWKTKSDKKTATFSVGIISDNYKEMKPLDSMIVMGVENCPTSIQADQYSIQFSCVGKVRTMVISIIYLFNKREKISHRQ